ncbi:MAG TPA: flagellar export protein FliJ [Lacipirellulaceae bacterium]|nr:flagellar export protein FliJ [Lacipirellulaceae bacterium]
MPKFHFRLQTLQRLRVFARDELRSRLAEAQSAGEILDGQRSAIAAEQATLVDAMRQCLMKGSLNVSQMLETQRYQLGLEAQARLLSEQAQRLAEEIDNRRQAVVEADRDVRVLEPLRDRRRVEHQRAQRLAEVKELDEIGAFRHRVHDR